MTEPRVVYAVSSGCYSDFRYLFGCENEVDAKAAIEAGHGDDYHELRVMPPGDLPQKVRVWTGHLKPNGTPWYSDTEEYVINGTDRDAVVSATEAWAEQRRAAIAAR